MFFFFVKEEVKRTIKLSRHLSDLVAYTRSASFKGLDLDENGKKGGHRLTL